MVRHTVKFHFLLGEHPLVLREILRLDNNFIASSQMRVKQCIPTCYYSLTSWIRFVLSFHMSHSAARNQTCLWLSHSFLLLIFNILKVHKTFLIAIFSHKYDSWADPFHCRILRKHDYRGITVESVKCALLMCH